MISGFLSSLTLYLLLISFDMAHVLSSSQIRYYISSWEDKLYLISGYVSGLTLV